MPTGANSMAIVFKGVKQTQAWLRQQKILSERAMNTAIKVEAFKLKGQLQKEIRSGTIGRRQVDALSFISRRLTRRPNRKALAKLAMGIRYRVDRWRPFKVEVGFVKTVSESFRRLAKEHQAGFTRVITQKQREYIVRKGAKLGTVIGGDTPFFLSKRTRVFKTPGRPIIDPFWQVHKRPAMAHIKRNFKLKLKGHRI